MHCFIKKLQITRSAPDNDKLIELYEKEKQDKLKMRYFPLVLMREFQNCKMVSELIKKPIKRFNYGLMLLTRAN